MIYTFFARVVRLGGLGCGGVHNFGIKSQLISGYLLDNICKYSILQLFCVMLRGKFDMVIVPAHAG